MIPALTMTKIIEEESLPQDVFHFHSNTSFHLQRQVNESKLQSISRDSVYLYNNRQKTLDWFMTLLRNYEVVNKDNDDGIDLYQSGECCQLRILSEANE